MPGSFDGTMNSSMTIFGGSAATAKQEKPAASAASECRMNFIFPPGMVVAEFCAFCAGRKLRRLRHAQQSALDERPERLVGLADAFGERHVSIVSQLGAKRLVGKVHGKCESLPRRGDRRGGRELPEDAKPLLDRRIHAV